MSLTAGAEVAYTSVLKAFDQISSLTIAVAIFTIHKHSASRLGNIC